MRREGSAPVGEPERLIGNSTPWQLFRCDRWRSERVREVSGLRAKWYTPVGDSSELVPPSFLSAQFVDATALRIPDSPVQLNGGNKCVWLSCAFVDDLLERRSSVASATRKAGKSGVLDIYEIQTVFRRAEDGAEVAKLTYTAIRSYPSSDFRFNSRSDQKTVPSDAEHVLSCKATPRDIVRYAVATEDLYEAHYDGDYARARGFPSPILHGLLKMAWFARAALESVDADCVVRELSVSYLGVDLARDEFHVWVVREGDLDEFRFRMYGGSEEGRYSTIGSLLLDVPSRSTDPLRLG